MQLRLAHIPMQFSDTPAQQRHDVAMVLSLGYDVLTWTEATPDTGLYKAFKTESPKHGYSSYVHPSGVGIAVKKTTGRVLRSRFQLVAKGVRHQYSNRGLASSDVKVGKETITFSAAHYVTGGRVPSQGLRYRINKAFAATIGKAAKVFGAGRKLFFNAADYNIVDRKQDVFFGQPLTTCWDELGKWPNTGHDNIDAIASYDADGRVKCVSARVLNDKVLPLYTDHFLTEAVYEIRG